MHKLLTALIVFAPTFALADAPRAPVRRVAVERRNLQPTLHLATTVGARQGAELPSPVSGTISSVSADLGARVKRGQALVTIEAGGKATRLLAPFDGVVIQQGAHLGAYVTAGGAVLVTLIDDSSVRLELSIPEEDAALVRVGQDTRAHFTSYPSRIYAGKVELIVPHVDSHTHTLHADASIDNADRALMVGMSGQADLDLPPRERALVVPRTALSSDGVSVWVFRVDSGRAHRVPVKLGVDGGDVVEVTEGLKDGDQIVLGATAEGAEAQ